MINRIFGYSTLYKATFEDLDSKNVFYSDCATAQSIGYMTGDEKNMVRAQDYISREQAMIILARISKAEKSDKEVHFADEEEISFWAKDYVDVMSSNGIVTGFEGYLNPTDSITVSEAAALVLKTFKWMHSDNVMDEVQDDEPEKDFDGVDITEQEFVEKVNIESLTEFFTKNKGAMNSIVTYVQKTCNNGVHINRVGKGLDLRDYLFGDFVKLSDEAIDLITKISNSFSEFSARYNPSRENAFYFVLGKDENGNTQGVVYTPLEELKNKELTNIEGNWYYYIQK